MPGLKAFTPLFAEIRIKDEFGVELFIRIAERQVSEVSHNSFGAVHGVFKLRGFVRDFSNLINHTGAFDENRPHCRFWIFEILKVHEIHVGQVKRRFCIAKHHKNDDKKKEILK